MLLKTTTKSDYTRWGCKLISLNFWAVIVCDDIPPLFNCLIFVRCCTLCLHVCLPNRQGSFVYQQTRSLIYHAIFSPTGLPRRVDWLAHYGIIVVKCLFQGHSNTLSVSGTKPRVDNFAIANLRSYPLTCTTASWNGSVKCLFDNSTLRLVWASNKQSYDYYSALQQIELRRCRMLV